MYYADILLLAILLHQHSLLGLHMPTAAYIYIYILKLCSQLVSRECVLPLCCLTFVISHMLYMSAAADIIYLVVNRLYHYVDYIIVYIRFNIIFPQGLKHLEACMQLKPCR